MGELAQALSEESDYYVKLETQNGSGTWIDVGAALGGHWIINASWGEHVDTPTAQATFTLVQQVGGDSLSPLMVGSVINVDDLSAYSPLLDIGRLIRAYTATMAQGVALDTGKYRLEFTGRIDSVEQVDNGGEPTPIVLSCSDLGAWLMDMQIKVGGRTYGVGGSPLEDVLQAVVDDNTPMSEPAVTVVKESSSSFAVTSYTQDEAKVLAALIGLVLDSVGEDIRYRFDASHDSQLMWFDPDRTRVTVDATITNYRLQRLNLALADIRNSGELPYTDSGTGVDGTVDQEDLTSIAKYRERFFRMPPAPLLQSSTEAQAVIDAVVHDLATPLAEFAALCPYMWFVQLFDRYTFPANNRTYDVDQTFAVVGYQHTIENGRGQTVILCGGRIIGAYSEWLKRTGRTIPIPTAPIPDPVLPPYTPPSTGLLAWFDASQETGYSNLDTIGTAVDFSGNSKDAICIAGFEPTYKTNMTPSGLPAFEFERVNNGNFGGDSITDPNPGEGQYLRSPILGTLEDGMTAYVVAQNYVTNSGFDQQNIYSFSSVANSTNLETTQSGDTPAFTGLKWNPGDHIITGAVAASWFVHAITFYGSSTVRQFLNNVAQATFAPSGSAADANCVFLGAGGDVRIAELRVYTKHSSAQVGATMLELMDKHGI
jgi:hypothetical protein